MYVPVQMKYLENYNHQFLKRQQLVPQHCLQWLVRVVVTGDGHIVVVEKLKAHGTETDASDEEFLFKGELTLVHDVFCLLLDCSSACKSLMI